MSPATFYSRIASRFQRPLKVFMSDDERSAIETALLMLGRPIHVVEWGSGGSTAHFSRRLPPGSKWLAVEHDARWASRVRPHVQGFNVVVQHIAPNGVYNHGVDDGTDEAFHDYVRFPAKVGETFDCAIVDGRARVPCIHEAWTLIGEDGFAAMHDAQRAEYATARPTGATRVLIRDPRSQVDGGDIELHFYFKTSHQAGTLGQLLSPKLNPRVNLTID